jgi:hypothetical protein
MRKREIMRGGYILQRWSTLAHVLPPGGYSLTAACGKHRFRGATISAQAPPKICPRCLKQLGLKDAQRIDRRAAVAETQQLLFTV